MKEKVEKIWNLLTDDEDSAKQALSLLDAIADFISETNDEVHFRRLFEGISFVHLTCNWINEVTKKMNYQERNRFLEEGIFWDFIDIYFRAYPEAKMLLPTVLRLRYAKSIPHFFDGETSCNYVIIDQTSLEITGFERYESIHTIFFDVSEAVWSKMNVVLDFTEIKKRTSPYSIIGPMFRMDWIISDKGLCELRLCKGTNVQLAKYLGTVSLGKYPLIEYSDVLSDDYKSDLWNCKSGYFHIEFGGLQLSLSDDLEQTIATRLKSMKICLYQSGLGGLFDKIFNSNLLLKSILKDLSFPSLENIQIVGEYTYNTNTIQIDSSLLKCCPNLKRINVETCPVNIVFSEDVWSYKHNIESITVNHNGNSVSHWEFTGTGTLQERLVKISSTFDWITSNLFLLEHVQELNIFQSDVEWNFVSKLQNISRLFVEGEKPDLKSFNFPKAENLFDDTYFTSIFSQKYAPNTELTSVIDLIFAREHGITNTLSTQLLNSLKKMNANNSWPKPFIDFLKKQGFVTISQYSFWINSKNQVRMKSYRSIGQQYLSEVQMPTHRYSCLNIERLICAEPWGMANLPPNITSVRYNDASFPVSKLSTLPNLQNLIVDVTDHIEDIMDLSSIRRLEITKLNLTKLTPSIGKLTNLKELYLWSNNLTELPSTINNLQKLEVINISGNQFISIPNVLFNLPNLKTICFNGGNLNKEDLKSYPKFLKKLESKELELVGVTIQ